MKLRVFGIRIPLLILGLFLSLGCSGDSAGDTRGPHLVPMEVRSLNHDTAEGGNNARSSNFRG